MVNRPFNRRQGFTLVEILVVVAIIAVIAAITFPVFRSVKASAKNTACISNLSQLGKASMLYAADSDTYLPPYLIEPFQNDTIRLPGMAKQWRACLMTYVKSEGPFYCPADTGAKTDQSSGNITGANSLVTSYEQVVVHGVINASGWSISIDQPAKTEIAYLQDRIRTQTSSTGKLLFDSYHGARMNCLFMDGSVKNISVTD